MAAASPPYLTLLLGDPVGHSLSPLIHNRAFRAAGVNAIYRAARTPARAFEAAIEGLRNPRVMGANITIPHKETAARLVDVLDPPAARIGAINTIVRGDGGVLRGYNTDVAGFLAPLKGVKLRDASVMIIGSGGAARAVAFALITGAAPARIRIAARNVERAANIVRDLRGLHPGTTLDAVTLDRAGAGAREADLLVNATPVGMAPHPDASALPDSTFRHEQVVYDLVYAPRETRLLREAAARGATTISGIEMLMAQAAEGFRLWTGMQMPQEVVNEILGTA